MSAALPVVRAQELADGEWHRLHPATPLLRGGIAFLAVVGVLLNNFRERIIDLFVGAPSYRGDPVDYVIDRGLVPLALLAVIVVLALFVAGYYLAWRFHSFRITEEVVEVRRGILFRSHRKARLDRVQAINISRPAFARLFGAAKLEISQAGHDANVQLSYLSGTSADALRAEILRLASGARESARASAESAPVPANVVERRVAELLAPEFDPAAAPPESVVRMHPARLAGSVLLSESALVFAALLAGLVVLTSLTGHYYFAFGFVPALLGLGTYLLNRFTKSLRYSIAATPDGVRVGFGLLSTTNETLPPGRIHSVAVSQRILWRPAGWWEIRVNRAARGHDRGSQQQQRSTILPVGSADDALRVLGLLLPGIDLDDVRLGLAARGVPGDGYTTSPRRAAAIRWFSWRRNGFLLTRDAVLLRRGAVWRELVIVPLPRVQSVGVRQGPILRGLRLAAVHVHTVMGPIDARLGALDPPDAAAFFRYVERGAIVAARGDTSHRWRSGEATA